MFARALNWARRRHAVAIAILGTLACCDCATLRGDDWPQFRGPTGQGISSDKNVPTKWSDSENVAWSVDVAGQGWSSPIVVDDLVVLTRTDASGANCFITAFNAADGKERWDINVAQQTVEHKEARNSYATPTPASDGQRIFATFGGGVIVAVDLAGSVLWKSEDYGFYSQHGLAASPIIWQNKLIISRDGSDRTDKPLGWQKPWNEGYVVALDTSTGKQIWIHKRTASRIAHTTPIIFYREDRSPALVSAAGDVVEVLSPHDGKPLFTYRNKGEGLVPSVVTGGGLAYLASGWGGEENIKAIPLKLAGENEENVALWTQGKSMPHIPSMLYDRDRLYSITENGIAMSLDAKTGAIVWQKRFPGSYSASPVLANGHLYFLSDEGKTTVINASDQLEIVAENELNEPCQASIAIANDSIYIRGTTHLFCIRNPQD
jgi:outer membrane protein assembly factor BamB